MSLEIVSYGYGNYVVDEGAIDWRKVLGWGGSLLLLLVLTEIHVHRDGLLALAVMLLVSSAGCWFPATRRLALHLLALELGFTMFWGLAGMYLAWVGEVTPFKYDEVLGRLDSRWLFDAGVFRRFGDQEWVYLVYLGLKNAVIFWYGWHIWSDARPTKFLFSLGLAYTVGPLFYLLVPAYGPYFPHNNWPNCMPSLHLTTALLMVAYRPQGGLIPGVAFALATAFVTLATGQHYVIDLVMALPFAGFVWAALERHKRLAGALLLLVISGILTLHLCSSGKPMERVAAPFADAGIARMMEMK